MVSNTTFGWVTFRHFYQWKMWNYGHKKPSSHQVSGTWHGFFCVSKISGLPKKNSNNQKPRLIGFKRRIIWWCASSFCGFFFAEVEGGILGLLQLPAGQAAVCQLAKTAEEVVNFGEAGLWMKWCTWRKIIPGRNVSGYPPQSLT